MQEDNISNINKEIIEDSIKSILDSLGDKIDKNGTMKTPTRVAKAYEELLEGYNTDIDSLINNALFDVEYDQIVTVKNISFYSLCEHHLLPFFGTIHIGYLPKDKIIGLSKLPRIALMFARRLQVQERLTRQIAETIQDVLEPIGVAVIMEGQHMCMQMRGVEKQNSFTSTSAMSGQFRKSAETRSEFLSIISRRTD